MNSPVVLWTDDSKNVMSPMPCCLHVSDGCPYVIDRVAMQHTDMPNQLQQLQRPTVTGKSLVLSVCLLSLG